MKIIITESQQTQLIGEAIMENFPEVVSINYSTRKVQLVNMGNKVIDVKVINVITDPYKVLEGNLNNKLGKYEFEDLFKNIFANDIAVDPKQKREVLTVSTLFGEEVVRDIKDFPRCYFYPELVAQIKESYEKSLSLKLPFRTMKWPTNGKQMLLPFSKEIDKVFISAKKHNENLIQKKFEKSGIIL